MHLHAKAAVPDHVGIVFPALLPGLNGVAKIDVHVRVSVETHDAVHVAGVEACGGLTGHVAQLREIFRLRLGRRHSVLQKLEGATTERKADPTLSATTTTAREQRHVMPIHDEPNRKTPGSAARSRCGALSSGILGILRREYRKRVPPPSDCGISG